MELPLFNEKKLIRRNHVDVVGVDRQAVFRLDHFHLGESGQKAGHMAWLVRIQMLDHHKSQPAVGRHLVKELFQ